MAATMAQTLFCKVISKPERTKNILLSHTRTSPCLLKKVSTELAPA
jgi:hypothetical protein